ncbi:MAG TPA: T9SS type A sorting domain-containing protein [Chitinophagales bacterium]|nr:T9SS type A sorting domain-containing protein [Chitinophagales bacterium]
MKTLFCFLISITVCFMLHAQQVDRRFGFEYNEIQPPITSEANHDTLLSRMSYVLSAQHGGFVNVNGAGWHEMQTNQSSPVDFATTDGWVTRFQDFDFELVFYLTPNTPWSQVNNIACANGAGDDECAPDDQHVQDWIDYVKAVVERYDGDGVNDMPGLMKPIRFYVLPQEVSFSGSGGGDADDANGVAFWDDNMQHLISITKTTYDAMHDADPTGNSKLVGSGGWFLDLYSDFPDYPDIEGPTVTARLNGQNLFGSTYQKGFDSLKVLLAGLNDTVGGTKCDYIGWHPHTGWKATDQSFKFVKTYAPDLPIFIDDMWSAMLTSWNGLFFTLKDGYCQFIGGDSIEGDFPTTGISSYQNLFYGLDSGDANVTGWYNAKTAREAVKCFATCFGGGAERVAFSMTNDINPDNIFLYPFSQPYRYTGMTERKDSGFAPKPVMYTMRLMVDELFDFTAVQRLNVSSDPHTRVYKFTRARGTDCYVAWSESGWNTQSPQIPNGETVSIPVMSDSLKLYHIITQPGQMQPVSSVIFPSGGNISIQLGFEPVIIEETKVSTGVDEHFISQIPVQVFPNPSSGTVQIHYRLSKTGDVIIVLRDCFGRMMLNTSSQAELRGEHSQQIDLTQLPSGIYLLQLEAENETGNVVLVKEK